MRAQFFPFWVQGWTAAGEGFFVLPSSWPKLNFHMYKLYKGGPQGSTSVLLLGSALCFKTNCDGPIKVVPSTHKKLCHAPQLINKKDEYIYLNIFTDPLSCGLSCFICEQPTCYESRLAVGTTHCILFARGIEQGCPVKLVWA
jgi:hypothetical protein